MFSNGRGNENSQNQPEAKQIVYHPQAQNEVIDAAQYYEMCAIGLGERFIKNVENASQVIQNNPFLFATDALGRRKYQIKQFPYILIYKIKNNCIFILAVAHGKRKPGYWKIRDS